jgi:hypothetical protein
MKTKTAPAPAPSIPAPSPVADWITKTASVIGVLAADPTSQLTTPPNGPVDPGDLARLVSILKTVNLNLMELHPHREAASRAAPLWTGKYRADALADTLTQLLTGLDRMVGKALEDVPDEVAERLGLIRTAAFGEVRAFPGGEEISGTGGHREVTLIAGLIDSLPAAHWLRNICPDPLLIDVTAGKTGLLLGRCEQASPFSARAWYFLKPALDVTAVFRARQLKKLSAAADAAAAEDRERRSEFWKSELGQMLSKKQALEQLEKSGRIPEKPQYGPVVRTAGRG